jgi:acetolactate synthase-1/2/3 large subunit
MVICGGGVVISGAESELQSFAEALNLTVATTISGQGSLADSHPLCLGVVGSNGGVIETREVVEEADLVLFIGCRAGSVTTERWRFPKPGQRILHIDVDPMVISANYETEVALNGDAQLALRMANNVLARSGERRDFGGADRIAEARKRKFASFEERAASSDSPIRPERVVATLAGLLDEDAVVVADPGTPCPFFSAFYQSRKPGRQFITNRAHGALGYSAAAVIGAHYGRPGAKCVSVMGDGSFGFTVGEYETAVRKNLPITYVVFSNSVFGWIKAGQKSGFGERYYSVDFSRSDHAAIAAAYGLKTWRVEDPADLNAAMKAALAADGPTLVDVISQPLQDANAPVSEWIS